MIGLKRRPPADFGDPATQSPARRSGTSVPLQRLRRKPRRQFMIRRATEHRFYKPRHGINQRPCASRLFRLYGRPNHRYITLPPVGCGRARPRFD